MARLQNPPHVSPSWATDYRVPLVLYIDKDGNETSEASEAQKDLLGNPVVSRFSDKESIPIDFTELPNPLVYDVTDPASIVNAQNARALFESSATVDYLDKFAVLKFVNNSANALERNINNYESQHRESSSDVGADVD